MRLGIFLGLMSVMMLASGSFAWRLLAERRRWQRWVGSMLVALGASIVLSRLFIGIALEPLDEGNWVCALCGEREHRTVYAGLVLDRETPGGGEDPEGFDLYRRWFEAEFLPRHDHDWKSAGCHSIGLRTVSCMVIDSEPESFPVLARLSDRTLAREVVGEVVGAPERQRARLLALLGAQLGYLLHEKPRWWESEDQQHSIADAVRSALLAWRRERSGLDAR